MTYLIKRYFLLTFLLGLMLGMSTTILAQQNKQLVLGAERMDTIVSLLKNKRVGLAVNQTSILEKASIHLLDTLLSCDINVVKVFAPEHGFRGNIEAGGYVDHSLDPKTGLPIISLYGKSQKPSAKQLNDIDVLVFDIQDVGARFYTYISTMHYLMEACAENHKEFIVLDRPNPNDYVDGPIRQPKFKSFVSFHPIPILHGLTVGELAQMINGEGWLTSNPKTCSLTVVKMHHWKHGDPYWLPVRPSPNLPNNQSILLFPSLCFFEGTSVSVGRGTYFPFQVLGYPDQKGGSFSFTPTSLPGFDANPMHKDKVCYGVDLREYPFPGGLSLQFVFDFFNRMNKNEKAFFTRADWFDILAGTDALRKQIIKGFSEEDIRSSWQAELSDYKVVRSKYLLYPDYPSSTEP